MSLWIVSEGMLLGCINLPPVKALQLSSNTVMVFWMRLYKVLA